MRWICTIEKIRHKRTLDPIRVAFNWSTERASKEEINQLDLEIVLEEPRDLTEELNDAARKYYEAVRDAVYIYDKFSELPNEDQVVFRMNGCNTLKFYAGAIGIILTEAGINCLCFTIMQKRQSDGPQQFTFHSYLSNLSGL